MTDGPQESGAMRRIFGMFSKVPGSEAGTTSCSLRAWRRRLGAEVMVENCGMRCPHGMSGQSLAGGLSYRCESVVALREEGWRMVSRGGGCGSSRGLKSVAG